AGIIVTPLNWRLKADEVDYCLRDSDAKAVVFEEVSAEAVAGSGKAQDIPRIAVGDAAGGSHRFADLEREAPLAPRAGATAEDISLMLYTSGTTGRPKVVPRRHRAECAAAIAHVALNQYRRVVVSLGVMPLLLTRRNISLLLHATVV